MFASVRLADSSQEFPEVGEVPAEDRVLDVGLLGLRQVGRELGHLGRSVAQSTISAHRRAGWTLGRAISGDVPIRTAPGYCPHRGIATSTGQCNLSFQL